MGVTPLGENEGVFEVCDEYKGMSWWNENKDRKACDIIFGSSVEKRVKLEVS